VRLLFFFAAGHGSGDCLRNVTHNVPTNGITKLHAASSLASDFPAKYMFVSTERHNSTNARVFKVKTDGAHLIPSLIRTAENGANFTGVGIIHASEEWLVIASPHEQKPNESSIRVESSVSVAFQPPIVNVIFRDALSVVVHEYGSGNGQQDVYVSHPKQKQISRTTNILSQQSSQTVVFANFKAIGSPTGMVLSRDGAALLVAVVSRDPSEPSKIVCVPLNNQNDSACNCKAKASLPCVHYTGPPEASRWMGLSLDKLTGALSVLSAAAQVYLLEPCSTVPCTATAVLFANIDDGSGAQSMLWSQDRKRLFVTTAGGLFTVDGAPPVPVGFRIDSSASTCKLTLSWEECPDAQQPLAYQLNFTFVFVNGTSNQTETMEHTLPPFPRTDGTDLASRKYTVALPRSSMLMPTVVRARIAASNSHAVQSIVLEQMATVGTCMAPTPAPPKPQTTNKFLIFLLCSFVLSAAVIVLAALWVTKRMASRRRQEATRSIKARKTRPKKKKAAASRESINRESINGGHSMAHGKTDVMAKPLLHDDDSDDDSDVGEEVDDFLLNMSQRGSSNLANNPPNHLRVLSCKGDEREQARSQERSTAKDKRRKAADAKRISRKPQEKTKRLDTTQKQVALPGRNESSSATNGGKQNMTLQYTIEQFSRRTKALR
jgi:hypothetical protein